MFHFERRKTVFMIPFATIILIEARMKLLTIQSVIDVISSSLPIILILKNASLKLAIRLTDITLLKKW